jgi:hypothetical protein
VKDTKEIFSYKKQAVTFLKVNQRNINKPCQHKRQTRLKITKSLISAKSARPNKRVFICLSENRGGWAGFCTRKQVGNCLGEDFRKSTSTEKQFTEDGLSINKR